MPNHCENDLDLYGPVEQVDALVAFFTTPTEQERDPSGEWPAGQPDYNTVIPYPAVYVEGDSRGHEYDAKWSAYTTEQATIYGVPSYWDIPDEVRKGLEAAFHEVHGPQPTDGYNKGGYAWCKENWGTKWNAYSATTPDRTLRTLKDGRVMATVRLSWLSAWGPPIPVIEMLADKAGREWSQVTLALRYYECGMAFCGKRLYRQGRLVTEMHSNDYHGSRGG